jgi:hypothetical protein
MFDRIHVIFFILLLFSSCGLNDTETPVPTYLILKDPKVDVLTLPGGTTHKITDIWVYADGQLQGIFPLPAKVPVISTGEKSEIILLAGIRKNGIFDSPAFYPFYKSIRQEVILEPLKEISIPLVFTYAQDAKFDIIADFEQVNPMTFDLDNDPATNLEITSDVAASGQKCGKITLPGPGATLEIATTETFNKLSLISGNAYIELDYKGECEIGIGLVTFDDISPNGQLSYKVVVVPRDNWNKVYIDITEELSRPRLTSYKLALGFTVPLGKESAVAYIDNVKLVRF